MPRPSTTATFLVIAQLMMLVPVLTEAASSYVTRRPEQGPHYHRVGPEQAIPGNPACSTYVPAYSNIYLFEGGSIPLAINLSIRNTDQSHAIFVNKIAYHGADGQRIEMILANPWQLAPMATATYIIDQHDMRGGFGANFIVEWVAPTDASPPLIETIMAGYRGAKGLSLNSRGVITGACQHLAL